MVKDLDAKLTLAYFANKKAYFSDIMHLQNKVAELQQVMQNREQEYINWITIEILQKYYPEIGSQKVKIDDDGTKAFFEILDE